MVYISGSFSSFSLHSMTLHCMALHYRMVNFFGEKEYHIYLDAR